MWGKIKRSKIIKRIIIKEVIVYLMKYDSNVQYIYMAMLEM